MPIKTELKDRPLDWLIKFHLSITSNDNRIKPDFWDSMVAQVEQLIKEKQFKEKKMKLIVIKFENALLVDYVGNELKNRLNLEQVEPHSSVNGKSTPLISGSNGKFTALVINGNYDIKAIAKFKHHGNPSTGTAKIFTITKASNADMIIEEIVKEYNKPEYKSFNIGGGFNGNKIKVKVYDDRVEFNSYIMSFDAFITMRNAVTLEYGGFKIGGNDTLQFTNANTGTKVYIDRSEFQPIIETILGKL